MRIILIALLTLPACATQKPLPHRTAVDVRPFRQGESTPQSDCRAPQIPVFIEVADCEFYLACPEAPHE